MANILQNIIDSTISAVKDTPTRTIQDINSSVGMKQKVMQTTGAFGGTLASLTTPEPRKGYNFKVSFGGGVSAAAIEATVKSVSRPKIYLDYRTARYMNTVRKTLRSIIFDPIELIIYDDLGGNVQRNLQQILFGRATKSITDGMVLGHTIDMKSFDSTIIPEIVIHSSTAPLVQLANSGLSTLGSIINGNGPKSLSSLLSNSGVQHMKMLNCTINSVDFGQFDYETSAANVITISFSYQALEFGNSTETNAALEIIGGMGAKVLTGAL